MKKLLLLSFLALGLLSFSPNVSKSSVKHKTEKKNVDYTCQYGQCQATAASTGYQCRHCVSNQGDSYCFQHR